MEIYGFQDSTIDYPGKIASVIFTPGCNFRCRACHARQIIYGDGRIRDEKVIKYLVSRKNWIDAVVLCGGEPTIQEDLPEFCRELKEETELLIKLDTNGSNPSTLARLLQESLVDYVALDVKANKYNYDIVTGVEKVNLENIEESMRLTVKFPDYEFRSTIAPVLRNSKEDEFSWFNVHEAEDMALWVINVTRQNKSKYFLQRFVPRSKEEMINERLNKEIWKETPTELMEDMKKVMEIYFLNCKIR